MKKISLLVALMLSSFLFANETNQIVPFMENQIDEVSKTSSTYCETETYIHVVTIKRPVMSMNTGVNAYEITTITMITGACTTCYSLGGSEASVNISCCGSRFPPL